VPAGRPRNVTSLKYFDHREHCAKFDKHMYGSKKKWNIEFTIAPVGEHEFIEHGKRYRDGKPRLKICQCIEWFV
jgi:hypothetical protein